MKKLLKTFALVSILSLSQTPQKADAIMIAVLAAGGNFNLNDGPLIACVIMAPFCLLDQEGILRPTSLQDLLDNGYSAKDANTILMDQKNIQQVLLAQRLSLKVQKQETRDSVRESLVSIYPTVSDLYVDFLTSQLGL